ncbi:hypothetical protein HLRTI_002143 [Halorhabdus tiamatea SARL4B]|uniref:Uncharacterized protein n=1 Tax=Halorhabdus tiamatea SARL4B TaxID=1033806 RepID=F7PL61_9EURY|nr:hypothetical protein [Halorhabdus tiamatea]ERJ05872.1 hypothetical protein HLRTI_002143 [Halorhabdus tiamatea SARL4B]CCQ34448.1 hypothetical protein HTIA_2340 [Halorhabdus tiamatea SARL4B]
MDRLASCYFCGVAVDAPLEEYPVVPRDLRPSVENQQTVVLCPQCRRKLSTIVDSVVAATADPDQTTLSGNESDTDETGSADAENVERTTEDVESSADRPADSSLIEGFGHDEPSLIEVEGTAEDDESTAVDGVAAEGEPERSEPKPEDTEDEDQTADADAADPAGATETGNDDSGDATASTAETETDDRDFSTSSYNRVVRLLQNRNFPLDVDEITTIAGSAYEIERRETEAIIDALVDRGVIERDGEQLFRPDSND